jgi:hypothetical protein
MLSKRYCCVFVIDALQTKRWTALSCATHLSRTTHNARRTRMSDWDQGDIDDELLALAGQGANKEKPRKKRQASSTSRTPAKRRKAEYV